jgi:dTDP-glucose 4,6-dehydratase/UDP-glucose 4-epimerase
VDALLLAAQREETNGQVFNLGDRQVVSLQDLAELLVKVNGGGGYSMQPFPPDRKKIDIGDYYSKFTKFEAAVGWTPKIKLGEGLARTLEYYRAHLKVYI